MFVVFCGLRPHFDCIPPIWSCCSLPRCKSLVSLVLCSVSYKFEGLPAESISQLISQFPYFYNDSRAEFLNIHSSFKNLMWHFKPLLIGFLFPFTSNLGFPGGSVLTNLPAVHEMWAWSLGQAHPLEKEMSTHSSFLAWKIPRTEELGRLQSMELPKSQTRLSEWTTSSVYLWDLQSVPIKILNIYKIFTVFIGIWEIYTFCFRLNSVYYLFSVWSNFSSTRLLNQLYILLFLYNFYSLE